MSDINLIYENLQKKGYRITDQRKAIIEILYQYHLTLKELKLKMAEKGFTNAATIFNNLKFLIDNKLIMEIYINNIRYYDLTIEEFTHSNNHIVHVYDEDTETVAHISNDQIIKSIEKLLESYDFSVNSIHLAIKGTKLKK